MPRMPGTFSPPPRVNDPDMHRGTCVTQVAWWMPGWLTSCFLWSRWQGKRPQHSRRMQFYVSGKRPMAAAALNPYMVRSSATLVLMMWDKQILTFHEKECIQIPYISHCTGFYCFEFSMIPNHSDLVVCLIHTLIRNTIFRRLYMPLPGVKSPVENPFCLQSARFCARCLIPYG